MIRFFDICFSFFGLLILSPLLMIIFIIGLFDTGSPLFRQERIGLHEKPFTLVKFRTMRKDTASIASHLSDPSAITSFGQFLRKTKLDELPQLWNVLKGEMSLVGPRPGLFNQLELKEMRKRHNVFVARPGITGLAQINNINMSTPELIAEIDAKMIKDLSVFSYFKYILMTMLGKGQGDAANSER